MIGRMWHLKSKRPCLVGHLLLASPSRHTLNTNAEENHVGKQRFRNGNGGSSLPESDQAGGHNRRGIFDLHQYTDMLINRVPKKSY